MVPVLPLPRRLRRLLAAPVARAATVADADRYRKHFSARSHLWVLLGHGCAASPSLRQTHAALDADPDLWTGLGLPPDGISRSQLARSTHSRPLDCFTALATLLRERVPAAAGAAGATVHLIDSSFLTLSELLCPWSRHGDHAPGVRLHTGFELGRAIPTQLHVTTADTPDITAWRERDWTELAGWTVLMDGGYYSHKDFATLREQDVSWVCPLNARARVVVTADHHGPWPPTEAADTILADQTITLGSPNNRSGAVLAGMRLVTSRNRHGDEHRTITDRFDLRADEVVALYRKRWQIELFFRFLKHELGVLHLLGTSRQAVTLTLLLAAIVAILAVLLEAVRPRHITDVAWVRQIGRALERALVHDPERQLALLRGG